MVFSYLEFKSLLLQNSEIDSLRKGLEQMMKSLAIDPLCKKINWDRVGVTAIIEPSHVFNHNTFSNNFSIYYPTPQLLKKLFTLN
jgi:hypothetical protein